MMTDKRLLILCGHYGSGKTNLAVGMALKLRETRPRLAVADLDIVNPYFRTRDSGADFAHAGIRLICSDFASSNVDLPAMPADLYAITDDTGLSCVLDIGGDDRGALALGRLAPAILQENNYDMWLVLNAYRPLTRTPEDVREVQEEIEHASGLRFTGMVNNSNLGEETTGDVVLASVPFAAECAALCGLPLCMTSVRAELYEELRGRIPDLFPLHLQKKIL